MAWSESVIVCRKHPDEAPQPGICPSCLRERLSMIIGKYGAEINNINNSIYNIINASESVSGSPPERVYGNYSASSSSGASPVRRHRRRHQRVASDVMDSIYMALGGGGGAGLKKSRSMANYAASARDGGVSHKKKGGFWNKLLLRSTGKKKSKFW